MKVICTRAWYCGDKRCHHAEPHIFDACKDGLCSEPECTSISEQVKCIKVEANQNKQEEAK